MKGRIAQVFGLAGLALCLTLPAQIDARQAQDPSLPVPDADNHHEVMVPMRDGVALATSVYVPEGDGPWPVIVERTPYSKAGGARKGQRLTAAVFDPRVPTSRIRPTSSMAATPSSGRRCSPGQTARLE